MQFAWRAIVVLAVFVGAGLAIDRIVVTRAGQSTPAAQVHLAAAMAGLFGGGAAASVVALALAFGKKR